MSSRMYDFHLERSKAKMHSDRDRKPCFFQLKVKEPGEIIKKSRMKKYHFLNELEQRQHTQELLDELEFFQEMLRTCEPLNAHFFGKALEIATGLQPWIDALRCRLNE